MTNKKTNPTPANQSGGSQPEKPKRKLRPVYFTDARWKALLETGNASHALNKLCDEAGYSEQPTPTLQDLLTRFWMCAYHGDTFPSQTVTVATVSELESAATDMLQAQQALRANNKDAGLKGVLGKSVTLSCNGYILRVTLAKTPKHTSVTATSREAYHSTDFSTQEGRIAQRIMQVTEAGEDVTRAEIANYWGIREGRVSARVFALLKKYGDGGMFYDGKEYRLVLTAPRLSRCPGASGKPNEAMRFEPVKQPADAGAQIEMF